VAAGVGGEQIIRGSVRVISAANRDLAAVTQGNRAHGDLTARPADTRRDSD